MLEWHRFANHESEYETLKDAKHGFFLMFKNGAVSDLLLDIDGTECYSIGWHNVTHYFIAEKKNQDINHPSREAKYRLYLCQDSNGHVFVESLNFIDIKKMQDIKSRESFIKWISHWQTIPIK